MRVGATVAAASEDWQVTTAVVPVAGRPTVGAPTGPVTMLELDPAAGRAGLLGILAQARWRDRLERAQPLPARARLAGPGHAEEVLAQLPAGLDGAAVHVVRSYLGLLGVALAERLRSPRLTIDLDDDDAATARALGQVDESEAFDRLVGVLARDATALAVASSPDAATLGERLGVGLAVVPNAVDVPAAPRRRPSTPPSLLLLGNLTYAPNVEAAEVLVREVLPRVRAGRDGSVRAVLVGEHAPGSPVTALAGAHVVVAGPVEEVASAYEAAACVVVPLAVGTGSRIKLLEAFAHEVPVVCTPAAARGLSVTHGTEVLIGSSADELAEQVGRLLADPDLGRRLARAGRRVAVAHGPGSAADALRRLLGSPSSR